MEPATSRLFRLVTTVALLLASFLLFPASGFAQGKVIPGPRDPDKSTVSKDGKKAIDRDKDGHVIEERDYDTKVTPKKLVKTVTYGSYHPNGKAAEMTVSDPITGSVTY